MIRWGVLAPTSYVARLAVVPALGDGIVATASQRGGQSYDDVLADRRVDAVYIPLPNSLHRHWTERAAAAGKHVLCEKPLAPTAADAAAMSAACSAAGVTLMEAYMTPFHPGSAAFSEGLGRLGELRHAHAAFTFPLADPANHRWSIEMGGGALLDVGIYCLAPLLAAGGGRPLGMAAAMVERHGVDATFTGWLDFGSLTASFECSFEQPERQSLVVAGTLGLADAGPRPFTPGQEAYVGMVRHFEAVVQADEAQHRRPEDSVSLLALMEELRACAS